MFNKVVVVFIVSLCGSWLCANSASAQDAAAFPACRPAVQPAATAAGRAQGAPGQGQGAQAGRGAAASRVPRDAPVTAIPGVVAADAKWTKVWQGGGNSADGLVAAADGSLLTAQEDFDTVLKI